MHDVNLLIHRIHVKTHLGSPSDEGVAGDNVFLCSFESFTRLCHESCGAASDRTPSLVSDPLHPRA